MKINTIIKSILSFSFVLIASVNYSQTATLSPSSVSITCGSTTSTHFTVSTSGITGITNYIWNLGATPNGWKLPNGTAAPATYSTGTTNNLTLTPVCGADPKNISVSVIASGRSYPTNTSTVGISLPSLNISGNASICTGCANYSITNLPCNASVTWSVSPASGATLSCTSCATTQMCESSNGTVTLTALISNVCGSNVTRTKTITVGYPQLTGTYSTATNTYPLETVNNVAVGNIYAQYTWPGVTNINASLTAGSPSGTGFYSFPGGFSFNIASSQNIGVYITGTSSTCGAVDATRAFYAGGSFFMVVSPNPVKNIINVSVTKVKSAVVTTSDLKEPTAPKNGVTNFHLYSENTGALIKEWSFKENFSSSYKLNAAGMPAGTYVLVMERDNHNVTIKVTIQ